MSLDLQNILINEAGTVATIPWENLIISSLLRMNWTGKRRDHGTGREERQIGRLAKVKKYRNPQKAAALWAGPIKASHNGDNLNTPPDPGG